MNKEVKNYLRVQRKLVVLEYVKVFGSNLEAYKACGVSKSILTNSLYLVVSRYLVLKQQKT